jgi:hypothetical protein
LIRVELVIVQLVHVSAFAGMVSVLALIGCGIIPKRKCGRTAVTTELEVETAAVVEVEVTVRVDVEVIVSVTLFVVSK